MATNSKKTETLVGLFLFLGLSILAGIILLFGNISNYFKDNYEVKVSFTEASGIIEGSTVRLRGVKIGEVGEQPKLTGGSMIQVVLDIEDRYKIDQEAVFQIEQAGIIGDKEIIITPPMQSSMMFLSAGAEVMGSQAGGLELLQNEAEAIAGDARMLLGDAKGAMAKLESSLDEIHVAVVQMGETMRSVDSVVLKMGKTMDTVNEGLLTEENVGAFGSTLANLNEASASFVEIGGKIDPVMADLRLAIGEIRETGETAKTTITKMDPALEKLPGVLTSLEKTANRATAAIDKVDSNDGALGALVSDEELKKDLKDFVRNLKKNGVLRYKDADEEEEDPRDRFQGRRR